MTDPKAPANGLGTENKNTAEAMLIILGAGASHDCLPSAIRGDMNIGSPFRFGLKVSDIRPPLTQQLAEMGSLTNWFATRWESARPVISNLRETLVSNLDSPDDERAQTLESALREYEEGAHRDLARRRQLMAFSFYLRDLLSACTDLIHQPEAGGSETNHLRLIKRVREWGVGKANRTVTFVSFNYDLILEEAMRSYFGFNPLDLSDYLNDPISRLLKPHGSVCWNWGFAEASGSNSGPAHDLGRHAIGRAQTEDVNRGRLILQNFDFRDTSTVTIPEDLVPALALPMDGKNEYVWPPEQGQAFEDLKGRVTRLMSIGWRALEPHFVPHLSPLVNPSCKVLVVAGGPDGEQEAPRIFQRLRAMINLEQWHTYGKGFTGLLERSEELKWFLED